MAPNQFFKKLIDERNQRLYKANEINIYGEAVYEKKIQFDTTVGFYQAEILI